MKSIRLSPTSIITVCDAPDNEIVVNGRVWRFDFDRHLGPTWLKKDGSDRKCQNPGKQVWDAFGKWFNEYNLRRWELEKRPTPETDAFLRGLNDYSDVELRAITEHARKLERERDQSNAELSNRYVEYDKLFDEAYQIRIERNEAREEVRKLKIILDMIKAESNV